MTQIAQDQRAVAGIESDRSAAATLMDQRDSAINQLSQLMDIRVVTDASNQTSVFTNSGVQLVGDGQASQMTFTSPGALNANSLYNSDPTKSGVGSLTIKLPNGSNFDMIANNAISSGQIAADLKLRDQTLVQAQTQVDQMAATLSSSLSDQTTAGTAVAGPPAGFDLDVSNVLPGNKINLTYTDSATNTQAPDLDRQRDRSVGASVQNAPNANPQVIGINFSGGMASIVSQLNAALGSSHLQFSNPSGSTLRAVDDGTSAATVNAASVTTTASSLAGGSAQLPLFTDGASLYTGAITGSGSQMTGLAGRITVNAALLSDPSKFVGLQHVAADGGRRYHALGFSLFAVDVGHIHLFAANRARLKRYAVHRHDDRLHAAVPQPAEQCGQLRRRSCSRARMSSSIRCSRNSTLPSGVNIDTEMSNLIALQNSYAANAHVMSVVQSMMTTLLQAQL